MVWTVRRIVNSSVASSSRLGQPQVQLAAAGDHVLEDAVDGVTVLAGPARDAAADVLADLAEEARRRRAALRRVGGFGEQAPEIAVVEVRVLVAVVVALAVVVLPQRLLQAGQRRQLAARHPARRMPGELLHELVHVLELLQRRPVVVALAPLRVRVEPHRERLGEVLVGMALRVPGIEVQHEALAVRLRRVVLGILGRRRPEQLEPLAPALQLVGVVDGVPGLVAQDLDAPVVRAALDLEHLALLELLEPRDARDRTGWRCRRRRQA